jgi:hypothetical protein
MIIEFILEKPKSRQRIEVVPDEQDDWFIDVNWVEKKTDKISRTSRIIRKDLDTWMSQLERQGWTKQ